MTGFCKVELDGVPPVNVQLQDVGLLQLASEKVIGFPAHTVVTFAVKSLAGGLPGPNTVEEKSPRPCVAAINVLSELLI